MPGHLSPCSCGSRDGTRGAWSSSKPAPSTEQGPQAGPKAAPSSRRDLGALGTSFTPAQEPSPSEPLARQPRGLNLSSTPVAQALGRRPAGVVQADIRAAPAARTQAPGRPGRAPAPAATPAPCVLSHGSSPSTNGCLAPSAHSTLGCCQGPSAAVPPHRCAPRLPQLSGGSSWAVSQPHGWLQRVVGALQLQWYCKWHHKHNRTVVPACKHHFYTADKKNLRHTLPKMWLTSLSRSC